MPYIKVSPTALSSMSETLRLSSSKVGRIESDFSGIAQKLDWDVRSASDIQRRMDRINDELDSHARMLEKMQIFVGNAKSKYESVQGKDSGGGGDGDTVDFADRAVQAFDIAGLFKKAIGAFGPVGGAVNVGIAIYEGMNDGDWEGTFKSTSKGMLTWAKFFSKYRWGNYAKTNRFGGGWGTKNYAGRLLNLARATSSKAAAWSKRLCTNFETGLTETFIKTGKETCVQPNWFGIIGVGLDLGINFYGKYKQVKAGEISTDRAVVEAVAETAANLILTTAACAIASTFLPTALATGAGVAIAGSAIMWVVDGTTKWITGGDKGLGELASEGVGLIYEKGKEVCLIYEKARTKLTLKAVNKVVDIFSNLCQSAVGTSSACCI